MTATDVEDRIRRALTDLAATTTTSSDARERIATRARPRGSRVRVALLAAAGLAVIVAGLVFVAAVVRGPASTDNELRGPGTVTTSEPSLPDGTTTWTFTGEDDGIAWTLEARRFPNGQTEVEASTPTGKVGFSNPDPSTVFAIAGAGGGGDVALVVGSVPPSASSARVTHPDAGLPIDVLGDGEGIGVRLFAIALPDNAIRDATFEAFAADGSLLGTARLTDGPA
jgi:hypothetical protein